VIVENHLRATSIIRFHLTMIPLNQTILDKILRKTLSWLRKLLKLFHRLPMKLRVDIRKLVCQRSQKLSQKRLVRKTRIGILLTCLELLVIVVDKVLTSMGKALDKFLIHQGLKVKLDRMSKAPPKVHTWEILDLAISKEKVHLLKRERTATTLHWLFHQWTLVLVHNEDLFESNSYYDE